MRRQRSIITTLRRPIRALAAMLAAVSCTAVVPTAVTVASNHVFDDFDGPAGAAPDPRLWLAETGSSAEKGWEQGSLQTYTDSRANVRLDGRGHLILQALESDGHYTSARLVTRGRVNFPSGIVAARIKLPAGQGIWPAFWMLGSNIADVGWPRCGEVDIMELIGTGTEYHVALHGPKADLVESGPSPVDLTAGFHTYWSNRSTERITIGVDDITLADFTPDALPAAAPWVFDTPMFVILNIAVGGDWPGPPGPSTPFPATMVVDWFRFVPTPLPA
ncbi:glycoside hydrolase family 16 protein [Mycolicibacterium sp. CBM1]